MLNRTHVLAVALVLAAVCAVPRSAGAFEMSGAGGKLGMTSPESMSSTVMVSGHLEFEQNDTRLHLMPSLAYWKADRVSNTNPNFDVYYHFEPEGRATPYLGGGLGVNVRNSDITDRTKTALGANVIGGFRFPGGANHYFLEGRYTASDVSQVALVGGVTFKTH